MTENSDSCEDKLQGSEGNGDIEDSNVVGQRMRSLNNALSMTTSKVLSAVKFSLFKRHYGPLYDKYPEVVKKIHSQITSQLEANMNEEMTLMFEEEQIEKLMNGLDKIIHSQSDRMCTDAWRPSGDVEKDSFACRMSVKEKQKTQLEHIISQLEPQNKLLRDHLSARQKNLLATKQEIDKHVEKWNEVVNVTNSFPMDQLEQFVEKYSGRL